MEAWHRLVKQQELQGWVWGSKSLMWVCMGVALICLCTTTKRRVVATNSREEIEEKMEGGRAFGWGMLKRVLFRWGGSRGRGGPQAQPPLLEKGGELQQKVGNTISPVWQRPILMGEKCELPTFSGLILYDERGFPLPHYKETIGQEKPAGATTLRDLL
ncbi:uncharacterized protein LOC18433733 [Amborella trichopoda]|nr:uncharacterized protein LOC18433733 [Amborella trichopoda]|eukprot:XP_006843877.2 uncharacterized protein LOC18433733 [Amborella trichopoda]